MQAVFVILFLVFPGTGFGAESLQGSIFNEYINSPDSNSESPVNKDISSKNATGNEALEEADNTDTKMSLKGIPPKDQKCAVDSDCTAGVVDCVSWEAFNKKYLHELLKHTSSCPASIDPGFQPVAICAAKACETTDKTTSVSWDDWLSKK